MRVVISAGGSGGHIYPALAIINKIKEQDKKAEFLYIGTTNRMEKDIVPKLGIEYFGIEIYGLKRKLSLSNLKSIEKYFSSIRKCKKEIKKFKPDIVIGAGGYVTAPVIYAGKKCGCKTLIHEQNSILGLSNKMMLKYTDTLCTSFQDLKVDGVNTIYTGNPQSENIANIKAADKKEYGLKKNKKLVLIVMGSQGSKTVNEILKKSLNKFKADYEVLIVTGKNYYNEFKKLTFGKNVFIKDYIDNLPSLMKTADLLVTRAGATTICELVKTKTPALFIPSPYVTENHQYKNAMALVKEGAGEIIEEKELTSEKLVEKINELINDEKFLKMTKENLEKFDVKDSSTKIYEEIIKLTNK